MAELWDNTGYLAFYLIFCIVSLAGSMFVALSIWRFGASTLSARLVLYLHYSQIIQDVMAIPYIWWANDGLCEVAGFLHIYSSIANIMCVTIMVIAYRYIFVEDTYKICEFCLNYLAVLVFVAPLLSLLAFSTHSFGRVENRLCSYLSHTKGGELWGVLFGIFAFLVFIFCVSMVIWTVVGVYRKDKVMAKKLFKTLVLYAIATLVFWVPRTVFQVYNPSSEVQSTSYILIFTAGLLYSAIFYQERKALASFEAANQQAQEVGSIADGSNMDFDFSFDEDLERASRASRASAAGAPAVILRGWERKETAENPMQSSQGSHNSNNGAAAVAAMGVQKTVEC